MEPSFLIHTKKGIVTFKENEGGIYTINMTNKEETKIKNKVSHVNIIADNSKHFSQKQQARANRARELYHTLGMP